MSNRSTPKAGSPQEETEMSQPKKGSDPIYLGSNLCEDGTYLSDLPLAPKATAEPEEIEAIRKRLDDWFYNDERDSDLEEDADQFAEDAKLLLSHIDELRAELASLRDSQ